MINMVKEKIVGTLHISLHTHKNDKNNHIIQNVINMTKPREVFHSKCTQIMVKMTGRYQRENYALKHAIPKIYLL